MEGRKFEYRNRFNSIVVDIIFITWSFLVQGDEGMYLCAQWSNKFGYCQCGQIGRFLKGDKFSHKNSPNNWTLFGLIFNYKLLWLFLENLGFFLFQHLVTLVIVQHEVPLPLFLYFINTTTPYTTYLVGTPSTKWLHVSNLWVSPYQKVLFF